MLNSQYSAEGPQTLIDGLRGDESWRKGSWLGCQGQDFVCIMDLKKQKKVTWFSLGCLQDTPSWIVFPSTVTFFGSNDNVHFTPLGSVANKQTANETQTKLFDFQLQLKQSVNYRYIKVVAKNFGKLPAWHPGSGGESFIFTDEFEVK
ncbi:MAG: hypothetical protein IT236_12330 [Bacteroidia bacterium]|nr:hypothetical protein [Bacteroidia bacterium]